MGAFAIRAWVKLLAWATAGIIVVLNAKLVIGEVAVWVGMEGTSGMLARGIAVPIVAAVGVLLLFILLDPFLFGKMKWREPLNVHAGTEVEDVEPARPFGKIAAALDFGDTDFEVLARAASLAASARCTLLLIHVVESAGALALGNDIGDTETQKDRERLKRYAIDLGKYDVDVEVELGFGNPVRVLPEMVERHGVELLVVGSHGHRGLSDLLHGSTVHELRHRLNISVLVVGRPGSGT
jgi:manganese transport protein